MVLYGVTIKHLQNIHKVMQSVDNTFISIIYLQIKSLYSGSNAAVSLQSIEQSIMCDVIQ